MKTKRLVGMLLIICMLVGLFYPTGQVSAVEDNAELENPTYTLNGKKYEVYYEDDFSDGGTAYAQATANFTTSDYGYIMNVESNALMKPSTLSDAQQYRALFTDAEEDLATNYSVSATFKMKDTTKFTAVVAYANEKGEGYEFGLIGQKDANPYFRIWNRSDGKEIVKQDGTATKFWGTGFDATEKEVTLRLEASTVDGVVTLKGYAIYDGVEYLVCEDTSTVDSNMTLTSGLPGVVSSDAGAPISCVSITSLGTKTDSNCLYEDNMNGKTGYRNALGYALSDSEKEYVWNQGTLKSNDSGDTLALYGGISGYALQNYTISADVTEKEVSGKYNGLIAYGAFNNDAKSGTTGYEFALYQSKVRLYGRSSTTTINQSVAINSDDYFPNYQIGDVVRLSITAITSDYDSEAGTATVRLICSAKHKGVVKVIYDLSYTKQAIYQGAPGIRGNNPGTNIDNVRVTSVGTQNLPYYENFEDSAGTIGVLYGEDLVVATETISENEVTEYNSYGTLAAGKTVYLMNASTWADYAVEADVTMVKDETQTGDPYVGIIAGYLGSGVDNGYEFDIYEDIDATTETYNARLLNKNGNSVVGIVRFDFTPGEVITLRMEVSGTQIKCYADGELLIDESIELPTTNTGTEITGSIGLRALKTNAKFDNLSVVPYEAQAESSSLTFPFVEDFDGGRAQLTARWDSGSTVKLEEEENNRYATLASYYDPETSGLDYVYDTKVSSLYLTGVDGSSEWTNYVYEADVTLTDKVIGTSGGKLATIVGAVNDSKLGYEFSLYYNASWSGNNYRVRLYDRINKQALNGSDDTLSDGTVPLDFNLNETVRLKMVFLNHTIQCYVNDELVIDYADSDTDIVFAGTIGIIASGNAAKFDNIIVSNAADYYPLAQYRSDVDNYTHPYKNGHVFGGWYTDAELTNALAIEDTTTACAYAKWVADEVLSVKAQLPAGQVVDANGRTVMRIVTTTDCDDYTETGFDVSTVNQSKTYTDTRLFTTIKAKSEYSSVAVDYTPSGTFHADSKYFSTIILYNLKATDDHLTKEFTIKPFWVTADGTKVYGVTRVLTIQEGIDALSNETPISPYSL